ncbi:MAG: 30S ribosomal protein S2 [bacterium]
MPKKLDLKEMLHAGIHFGHKTSRWSPKMRPYIWGAKNKVHLIDVSKTAFLLEQTGKFLKDRAAQGKSFLWIGTKKPATDMVKKAAISLNMPYVIHRWIGGTLSNYDQVKKAITRLLYLQDVLNKPSAQTTKKELVVIQKEIERLEKNVGGIVNLGYPPEAIIVIDAKKEQSAVREASALGIPVVGMLDTNTDPDGINFVIPANDDSPQSIKFVLDYLTECVQEGIAIYKETSPEDKKGGPKAIKLAPKKDELIEQAHAEKTALESPKETVEIKEPLPLDALPIDVIEALKSDDDDADTETEIRKPRKSVVTEK